jgi:hypothetical protein
MKSAGLRAKAFFAAAEYSRCSRLMLVISFMAALLIFARLG